MTGILSTLHGTSAIEPLLMLPDPSGDLIGAVLMQDQAGRSAVLAGFERNLRAESPVFPDKQTFSRSFGMSQKCHFRK
jgi:hypothetical protein